MNRIWISAVICLFGLSGSVFAEGEDMGTIFHHQAAPGKYEVWPVFTYKTITTKLNSDGALGPYAIAGGGTKGPMSEYKSTLMIETLRGEYGLTDLITVGVDLSMGNIDTKVSPDMAPALQKNSWTNKGLMDPTIFANAKLKDIGPGTLYVGVPLTISTGTKTGDSDLGGNNKSGGYSVAPWLGYDMLVGPGHLGVHLAYSLFLTNRHVEKTSNTTGLVSKNDRTGGRSTELDVFYEMQVATMAIVGAGINYGTQSSTFTKNLNSGIGQSDDNGVSGAGAGVYGTVFLSPTMLFTPVVRLDQFADTSTATHVKSVSMLTGQLYGTFIF